MRKHLSIAAAAMAALLGTGLEAQTPPKGPFFQFGPKTAGQQDPDAYRKLMKRFDQLGIGRQAAAVPEQLKQLFEKLKQPAPEILPVTRSHTAPGTD